LFVLENADQKDRNSIANLSARAVEQCWDDSFGIHGEIHDLQEQPHLGTEEMDDQCLIDPGQGGDSTE
jgi:hypothetical protein